MPKRNHQENGDGLSLPEGDREDDVVCGACLLDLFVDEHPLLGVPAGCPHLFHWDCLNSWALVQNSCPQCKNRFRMAGKYTASGRELIESVTFKRRNDLRNLEDTGPGEELPVELCEACKEPGSEESFILCDGMDFTCNSMFHYACMGFESVPAGLWFCPDCIKKGYIPEELKTKKSKPVERSPKANMVMPAPNMFPRSLVVSANALTRRDSSRLPRNLVQPNLLEGLSGFSSASSTQSVFARFRQRRLDLKRVQP